MFIGVVMDNMVGSLTFGSHSLCSSQRATGQRANTFEVLRLLGKAMVKTARIAPFAGCLLRVAIPGKDSVKRLYDSRLQVAAL